MSLSTIFTSKKDGKYQWDKKMPFKDAMRRIILIDNLPDALTTPLRMVSLPGEDFTTEKLLAAHGMPIDRVLGLESIPAIYTRMKGKKGLPKELKQKIRLINARDRDIFQFDRSSARRKAGISIGFGEFWLDYVCAFSESVNYAIGQLALNKSLLSAHLKRHGCVRLHIAVKAADPTEKGATRRLLAANAAAFPELCPQPPIEFAALKDQATLKTYYSRAAGIAIQINRTFNGQGYQVENIDSFYYRSPRTKNGTGGTTMLFLGFKITYAGTRRTEPSPTKEPVFLGIQKYENIPHTKKITAQLRSTGILAFTPEEDTRFENLISGIKAQARFQSPDLALAAESTTKKQKAPVKLATLALAATINALHKKTKISQADLETAVAAALPQGTHLKKTKIKSGVTKLRNLIALAKNALTQGEYQNPPQKDGILLNTRGIALCKKKVKPHASLFALTIEGVL